LRNRPGGRQTAGDFTGKYSRADRVSDQGGGAETDTERRMSGTNEMRGKA